MSKTAKLQQALHAWMDVAMLRSMRGWALYAKSLGLSMPQFSILMQLHHHGHSSISAISERFEITSAAASQHVENLVRAGLLARSESPDDRRAREIELTEKARSLIEEGMRERHAWMDPLAEELDERDREGVRAALVRLVEAARKLDRA